MFSIGIYIFTFLYLNCFLHAVIYFVHCALSLIILFYICACCDTRYFKYVCLFLFVEVKALLGLCYMLYNIRRKIKFLCLCLFYPCCDDINIESAPVYNQYSLKTLCIRETLKPVLWQTVKTQMKCSIMLHFIRVYTVCKGK